MKLGGQGTTASTLLPFTDYRSYLFAPCNRSDSLPTALVAALS